MIFFIIAVYFSGDYVSLGACMSIHYDDDLGPSYRPARRLYPDHPSL